MMKILFSLSLFVSLSCLGALPPTAQTYLNKIPGKNLNLPFVIQTALKNSDTYRIVGLQYVQAEVEEQMVSATGDFRLNGSANYNDDNTVKDSVFQASRSKKWDWSLGVSKYWTTGTRTTLSWVHDWNLREFASRGASPFAGAFLNSYKQSAAVFRLEQNLLKDSFGYSYRNKMKAASVRSDAMKLKTQGDLEATTLGFVNLFYQAWLTQQQVDSLSSQVKRQEKLLKVMRRKSRKGAVEKPELIQVEALLASTRSNYLAVESALRKQWEALVYDLKLPIDFLKLNPMDIPTEIDQPVPLSLRTCGLKQPRKTSTLLSLEKKYEAAQADFDSVSNNSYPDLKLIAGYRGNSIDGSGSTTVQGVLDGRTSTSLNTTGLGPAWNVGLVLDFPLDNSLAKAERTQKFITKETAQAQLQIEKDKTQTQWIDLCRQLRVEFENEKVTKGIVKEQRKRVKAENKRFFLGRISVNTLVQAEDDLGDWEFRSHQKSVQVRNIAWQVQSASGELYKKVAPIIKERMASIEGAP